MSRTQPNTLKILNTVFYLGVVFVNWLANTLPLGGATTGEVSAQYTNLFTPAGLTFSIWGLIYAFLLAFCLIQLVSMFKAKMPAVDVIVSKISFYFIVSSICNMAWLFAWHYRRIELSLLVMICLLTSLILIYRRLRTLDGLEQMSLWVKLSLVVPFSLYLAWITVATIANTAILLVKMNWQGFGVSPVIWTVVVITVATGIALINSFKDKDIFFSSVVVWAFIGIIMKRLNADTLYWPIIITAGIGILLILVAAIYNSGKKTGSV